MSSLLARGNAIIQVTGVDFSASQGLAVKFAAGVPAVNDSATVPAAAVVLDGNAAGKPTSVGILGALPGPVYLKLSAATAAVKQGDRLQQAADGTFTKSLGAGNARVDVAVGTAPNGGVAGDLVEAATLAPMIGA